MAFARSAGILLHPTSLPGFGGIGSLGTEARAFVETMEAAGIGLWQVLPLGPTGYGDAPYSALSAFAGNPLLIDLEPLRERGLLVAGDLAKLNGLSETSVDFARVVPAKMSVLRGSFERFPDGDPQETELQAFCAANAPWLDDFALFMALKDSHRGQPWYLWPADLKLRQPAALAGARRLLDREIAFHQYVQWLFFRQWTTLKEHANRLGVRIVGDMPIFVAHDCSDVWANQTLFQLNPDGVPVAVTGVPPDYFSPTGQLWGNPHYRWDFMEAAGFDWWIERFRVLLRMVDIVRIDHFRGFAAAWTVHHEEETAMRGEWVRAPGASLFAAVRQALGDAPIIAEDLGFITPDVDELRATLGFPGMKVLQFAFGTDASNPSLPHNFTPDTVVYTGTHDNDTTVGWYSRISTEERYRVQRYVASDGLDISWDLMRLALASVANQAIVPLQDVLRLGSEARMNLPGHPSGNWSWRFTGGSITEKHIGGLRVLIETYGRAAPAPTTSLPDTPTEGT